MEPESKNTVSLIIKPGSNALMLGAATETGAETGIATKPTAAIKAAVNNPRVFLNI
jgi:hypothetical protein